MMTVNEIVTIVALFTGPLAGVGFSLWYQSRKEKSDRRKRVFITLMAHRKTNPPSLELVNNLNVIDVVFDQDRRVVELWHQYYDLLCQKPLNQHLVEAKYLDLLAAMARVVGFSELAQTDIARFYTPDAYATQYILNYEMQTELIRILKTLDNELLQSVIPAKQPLKQLPPPVGENSRKRRKAG